MKINKVKINGFGKIQNKEFEFGRINLIQGENESGKSTLFKFITSMFYGASKNKEGKTISDFEKYIPWKTEEYSGKIEYELDNKDKFEVFREFRKKSPVIYNNKKEDITKDYPIDKNKENRFFIEQTRVPKESFFSTVAIEQEEVKLNKNARNNIIQRLTNIVSSGDENISFKKTIENLNKRQMEEIGTDRSNGRPINIVNENIRKLENEREKLKIYEEKQYSIKQNKELVDEDIKEDKIILEILRKHKNNTDKLKLQESKIRYIKEEIEELRKNEQKVNKKGKRVKQKKPNFILPIFLIIIIMIIVLLTKQILISVATLVPIIYIISSIIKLNKKNDKNLISEMIRKKEDKLETENKIYERDKREKEEEIINLFQTKIEKETIQEILSLEYEKIVEIIGEKEREIADYNIEKKGIEVKEENIEEYIEKLIEIEEKLSNLKEERKELYELNKIFQIVKEEIEESYKDAKDNITPDFINDFKNILGKTTNNKYKNIYIESGSDNEIKIEQENGQYMGLENLSTGTIDLIYLALRISAGSKISTETMPILLDESFAYYDDKRLNNILNFITENYNNQIFILSCTNREKQILDASRIEYTQIKL